MVSGWSLKLLQAERSQGFPTAHTDTETHILLITACPLSWMFLTWPDRGCRTVGKSISRKVNYQQAQDNPFFHPSPGAVLPAHIQEHQSLQPLSSSAGTEMELARVYNLLKEEIGLF